MPRARCPRLTAAMILSGSAVQVKGLGCSLASRKKRLIAACSSTIERKTPRLSLCLVSLADRPRPAADRRRAFGIDDQFALAQRREVSSSRVCVFKLAEIGEEPEFVGGVTSSLKT